LLDDGLIVLEAQSVEGTRITCLVKQGGKLADHKGLNKQGGGLSAPALTDKDRRDVEAAARLSLDFVSVSFARNAGDIEEARALLRAAGGQGHIVAKIERAEAVENIRDIIDASDVIMVARGDLAVEVGYASMTGLQKGLIRLARARNKVCITATQMLESMINSPSPTRAEVSDVANAVMDGTDAVMLSAETAVGKFPVRAVQTMAELCVGAEKHETFRRAANYRLEDVFGERPPIAPRPGYLDPLPVNRIKAFEDSLLAHIRSKHADILDAIRSSSDLSDAVAAKLKSAVESFAKSFA